MREISVPSDLAHIGQRLLSIPKYKNVNPSYKSHTASLLNVKLSIHVDVGYPSRF